MALQPIRNHFDQDRNPATKIAFGDGREVVVSEEVLAFFERYGWPGNIRQLANTIERAVILEESDMVHLANLALPPRRNRERVR